MIETQDIKSALLAAHGKVLNHDGRRYKLSTRLAYSKYYGYDVFSCHAENLTPKDETEAKYCLTDLWASDSESSVKLLYKFVSEGSKVLSINH